MQVRFGYYFPLAKGSNTLTKNALNQSLRGNNHWVATFTPVYNPKLTGGVVTGPHVDMLHRYQREIGPLKARAERDEAENGKRFKSGAYLKPLAKAERVFQALLEANPN